MRAVPPGPGFSRQRLCDRLFSFREFSLFCWLSPIVSFNAKTVVPFCVTISAYFGFFPLAAAVVPEGHNFPSPPSAETPFSVFSDLCALPFLFCDGVFVQSFFLSTLLFERPLKLQRGWSSSRPAGFLPHVSLFGVRFSSIVIDYCATASGRDAVDGHVPAGFFVSSPPLQLISSFP